MKFSVVVFSSLVGLAACNMTAGSSASMPTPPAEKPGSEASPLLDTLSLFASERGQHWDAYIAASGVTWLDKVPAEYTEGKYAKNGRLLLIGFGPAKLPNGKTGVDYGTVDGNEGESGVTLDGDSERVQSLSVKKFYFSEDYQGILQRQIGIGSAIKRVADACTPEEDAEIPGKNVFFEISFANGQAVYAEAFLETGSKYSPGYTVFDFQRDKPAARIAELGCHTF